MSVWSERRRTASDGPEIQLVYPDSACPSFIRDSSECSEPMIGWIPFVDLSVISDLPPINLAVGHYVIAQSGPPRREKYKDPT